MILILGVMKKAVKWASTSIDECRPTGKEQSGRCRPSKSAVMSKSTKKCIFKFTKKTIFLNQNFEK